MLLGWLLVGLMLAGLILAGLILVGLILVGASLEWVKVAWTEYLGYRERFEPWKRPGVLEVYGFRAGVLAWTDAYPVVGMRREACWS